MSLTVLQRMGVRCYAFVALPLAVICYFIASTPIAGDPTTSPLGLSQALYKAVFYAVIAGLAVAPLALGNEGLYCRLLASRPMVWLGEISYEIFLIHLVTMEFAMVYIMQDHVYTGSMAGAVRGDGGGHHPAGLAVAPVHPGARLTCSAGTTTGATNSVSIARSSASSRPGNISSDVITRTSQRPRPATLAGWSSPSEVTNAVASAVITSDCSANSAPSGGAVVANQADSAGLSRTRRSVVTMPATSRSRGSSMPSTV